MLLRASSYTGSTNGSISIKALVTVVDIGEFTIDAFKGRAGVTLALTVRGLTVREHAS